MLRNNSLNIALHLLAKGCILFLFFSLDAQTNLVPNPSFENYTQCPTAPSQIGFVLPWKGPTNNSTDYYNVCSTAMPIPGSIKANGYFQNAKTGNAFAGMNGFNGNITNYREYLQVQMSKPLIQSKCYYVEFYVNLANDCMYAINSFGAHISKVQISTTGTGQVLDLTPDIFMYKTPYIDDTLSWTKVSGIFMSQGDEQFLTIGNFKNDINTGRTVIDASASNIGYYFVDDVSVIEIDNTFKPTWAYRDTTITQGDSVFIGTRTNGLKSIWYQNGTVIGDSVPGLYVRPQVTTSYVVNEIIPCGNTRLDTVTVTVIPDPVVISVKVKKTCFREQNGTAIVAVTSGIQPFSYKWSNGTKTAQATGLSAGTYTVTVTDKHTNTATASIVVLENPKLQTTLSITDPTSGNNGAATVNVTGGTKPYTYLWSNGKTTKTISSLTNKTYYVTVTDSNLCVLKDTVPVGDVSVINGKVNQIEDLHVFPNPVTNGVLYIESEIPIEQIGIFNVLGIKIFSWAGVKSIDVSGFEKGIYFLKVKIKNTEILKRIIIQ